MAKKKALKGFSMFNMFSVTSNDTSGYALGVKLSLPEVQKMTRDVDETSEKIYADDMLYLDNKTFNGVNFTITVAEMSLELMAKLGFGEYDDTSQTLKADPQGQNKEFAATFRIPRVDGGYRLYKWFCFTVNAVKESETTTRGEGGGISPYLVDGVFTKRKVDDQAYEVRDVDEFDAAAKEWLEMVAAVNP